MNARESIRSLAPKTTISILIVLLVINALWAITLKNSGPVIAFLCYALITFLCWRRGYFQAGIIGGFFGLGIHVFELLFQDVGRLEGIQLGLFYANTLLPIPLVYFSYKAHLESKRDASET